MEAAFESSIAEPGGASRRCPVCHQHVAIGVQCSLCHRWYHITPPPMASGSALLTTPPSLSPAHGPTDFGGKSINNMSFGANLGGHTPGLQGPPSGGSRGRRPGCVAVPFLMPYFCAHCCRTAAEVLLDTQVEQRPGGLEDLPLYGHDPDMDGDSEDDDDFDAARAARAAPTGPAAVMRRNKELVERAISEIAKAPEISRGSRVEVQIKWKNLFQPAVLRRTRATFSSRGLPLYGDPTAASTRGAGGPGAGTMPEVEVLETDRYEQMADAIIDGHTSKQAPTSVSGHLSALERQSDMTLRQQRRHWIGQPLDYANVGRASLRKTKSKRGAISGSSMAMPPTGSAVRLSHVAVRVDGSDDDEELIDTTAPPAASPKATAKATTDGAATA